MTTTGSMGTLRQWMLARLLLLLVLVQFRLLWTRGINTRTSAEVGGAARRVRPKKEAVRDSDAPANAALEPAPHVEQSSPSRGEALLSRAALSLPLPSITAVGERGGLPAAPKFVEQARRAAGRKDGLARRGPPCPSYQFDLPEGG